MKINPMTNTMERTRRGRGNRPKFTVEEVCRALSQSKGMVTIAAKRLGCTYQTICNYKNRHPEIRETVQEALAELLDLAESKLLRLIEKSDLRAIIFFLRTKGRDRGYTTNYVPSKEEVPREQEPVEQDLEKKRTFILACLENWRNIAIEQEKNNGESNADLEMVNHAPLNGVLYR